MMAGSVGHNAPTKKAEEESPIPPNATLSELIGGTPSDGAKQAARESKADENKDVTPVPEQPPSQPATFSDAVPYITTPLEAQTAPNGTMAGDPKAELAAVPEGIPLANGQATGMQLARPKLQRSESKMVSAVKNWKKGTERAKILKRLAAGATVADDYGVYFDDKNLSKHHNFDETDQCQWTRPQYETLNDGMCQSLSICIMITGTRGDVQPFVAIGQKLKEYGHRVRLATHSNFRDFVVKDGGLEFYPLGGDPKILAAYMVKNKGIMPANPTDIPVQRAQLKAIIKSTYAACIKPDPEGGKPFTADAIIANPVAYGHIHVAEKMKIPLHLFFTMPWSPTTAFPHPLTRPSTFSLESNYMTYTIIDYLMWLGTKGIINAFRRKQLGLKPVGLMDPGSSLIHQNKVPFGYIWSPSLVPKPKDWGPHIDVVGFCFLDLAKNYKPEQELVDFLKAGPPPVYIGFGSLAVPHPEKTVQIFLDALKKTNSRGLISKGWGELGEGLDIPDTCMLLGNVPHDWLFTQCQAVIHHGGAGTTAAGLKAECPTTVIPFFGDQPFWGERCHAQGVGPKPIPIGRVSVDNIVEAIDFMKNPEVKENARKMAAKMQQENGVEGAVKAFHKHLPKNLRSTEIEWGLSKSRKTQSGLLSACACTSTPKTVD
ncbi:UDP-Glycosyltransferase superfamily protein [Klebsormidium nitens]|uniref:UDP-Glycosyltransferase superfamily protein n=1 Tax=Klebsormidium nitens TaxID=105231 RepID=A0A0U9HI00_KLENI|nr:UDP-Glycosyltransferase superfamily protein [Klebsormidium nitens]|eukprot:GAQ77601.1 UDP-Glycosyltransferase superfamily protein [Klebsormidium nitens]